MRPPALLRLPVSVLSRAPWQLTLELRAHAAANKARELIVTIALGASSEPPHEGDPQAQRRSLSARAPARRLACQGPRRRR